MFTFTGPDHQVTSRVVSAPESVRDNRDGVDSKLGNLHDDAAAGLLDAAAVAGLAALRLGDGLDHGGDAGGGGGHVDCRTAMSSKPAERRSGSITLLVVLEKVLEE